MKNWPPDPWGDFRTKLAEMGFRRVKYDSPEEMMLRAIQEILLLREQNKKLETAVSRELEEQNRRLKMACNRLLDVHEGRDDYVDAVMHMSKVMNELGARG